MATKKQKEVARKNIKKHRQHGKQCYHRSMQKLSMREEQGQNLGQEEKENIIVLKSVQRKNLLPLGTTMLDNQDMHKDSPAKDQVDHGMM